MADPSGIPQPCANCLDVDPASCATHPYAASFETIKESKFGIPQDAIDAGARAVTALWPPEQPSQVSRAVLSAALEGGDIVTRAEWASQVRMRAGITEERDALRAELAEAKADRADAVELMEDAQGR